jgi:hypothetical protein
MKIWAQCDSIYDSIIIVFAERDNMATINHRNRNCGICFYPRNAVSSVITFWNFSFKYAPSNKTRFKKDLFRSLKEQRVLERFNFSQLCKPFSALK